MQQKFQIACANLTTSQSEKDFTSPLSVFALLPTLLLHGQHAAHLLFAWAAMCCPPFIFIAAHVRTANSPTSTDTLLPTPLRLLQRYPTLLKIQFINGRCPYCETVFDAGKNTISNIYKHIILYATKGPLTRKKHPELGSDAYKEIAQRFRTIAKSAEEKLEMTAARRRRSRR